MKMRKRGAPLALAAAIVSIGLTAAPGCGEGGPAVVQVTGTVTQNNKPLEGAAIMFLPDPSNPDARPAEDMTGPDGNYKLRTGTRFGAIPGKYHVVITPPVPAADMSKVDPAFANDPYMANLSLHGDQTGPATTRKGKAAPKATEHSEDREVTTEAKQVHDFDVKLKAVEVEG